MLLVVNPNNPTGRVFEPAELLAWHARLQRRGGWLLVDEAFMDCTPQSSLAACSSPAARPWPAASRALSRCQWASRRALAPSVAMKLLVAATLRSCGAERHDEFAGGFQRRIFGIHQGDAQGAAFAQDAQAVHEIGALS